MINKQCLQLAFREVMFSPAAIMILTVLCVCVLTHLFNTETRRLRMTVQSLPPLNATHTSLKLQANTSQ